MRRRPLRASDRGFTLVELLVTISLFAVVMTLLTMMVVTLTHTFTRQETQQDNSNGAALGMQRVGQVIRAGGVVSRGTQTLQAFAAGNRTTVSLHAYLDADSTPLAPTRVTIERSAAGELIETRIEGRVAGGVWVFDRPPSRRQVIARNVAAPGSTVDGTTVPALFRYQLTNRTWVDRALTSAELADVVAVEVAISVQTNVAGGAPSTRMLRTFGLPNLTATREVG